MTWDRGEQEGEGDHKEGSVRVVHSAWNTASGDKVFQWHSWSPARRAAPPPGSPASEARRQA